MAHLNVDIEPLVIETGVDKLVALVKKHSKISLQDAAKQLGVSKAIIEEWADFLEEEGIISLEYKLTNTYLVERKLTKKEIDKKSKDFHGAKEAFTRKVESTLTTLEKECKGIVSIKEEFNKVKKELDTDIGKVKGELDKLDEYRTLKLGVDKQISQLQLEYRNKILEGNKNLEKEKKRFQDLIAEIVAEEQKLESERAKIQDLQSMENDLKSKLIEFRDIIGKIEERIKIEDKQIGVTSSKIDNLKKIADKIHIDIDSKRKEIESLLSQSKNNEAKINELQQRVLSKMKEKAGGVDSSINVSKTAGDKFRQFFEKKCNAEKLIDKIHQDHAALTEELKDLLKKSKAFDISTKSANVPKQMQDLKKKFDDVDKRKGVFESELKELNKLVKGT